MTKITTRCLKSSLLGLLFVSSAAFADFYVELKNGIDFTKTTSTVEHLDRNNYVGTAPTSSWRSNKEFSTYVLTGELIWIDKCSNFYAKVSGDYGWVLNGRTIDYPLRWGNSGHTKGYDLEVGYIMDVCERFKFIPYVGYNYNIFETKLKGQHEFRNNPNCFANQSGNKSSTTLYFPYIGIELDFTSNLCGCKNIQFSTSYQFGYGAGHGKNTVPYFFVTDDPATSRYGSRVRYEDMINHQFGIAAAYPLAKAWEIALEFDYDMIYNTHKLRQKLQNNSQIVEAGQYTATQYHRLTDYFSQTYSITLSLVYSFSGESGTWVR